MKKNTIKQPLPETEDLTKENNAILGMMRRLSDSGRHNFTKKNPWEKCLCALIMTLNPKLSVRQFLEALPYHNHEMDEADTLNAIAHLGYFARPSTCHVDAIDDRLLPCLFIPDFGMPYVILGKDSKDTLKFCDPETLMISSYPPSKTSPNGKGWFFQRYDENRPSISKFMRNGSGKNWFRALMDRFHGTFFQIMITGLMLNLIALLSPLFIMLVYDRVIASETINVLPMLAIGAFIALIFETALRNIRSHGLSWLAGRLDNIVGNRIFSHLIGLPPKLIEKASVASQLARIKTFESVRDFFSGSVFLSLLEMPFVVLAAAAIAAIAGPLIFVPLAMIAFYLVIFIAVRARIKNVIRLAAKASSARQQFTIETFEKIDAIRGHGLTKKWQEKFRHLSGREMVMHFHLNLYGMIAETLAHSITVLAAVATVGFGVHMIWSGMMTTGALVATMILVWRVLTPFYSLCTMIPRLEQLRNSIAQVNTLMDMETESQETRIASRLPRLKGGVSFDLAGLQYGDKTDIVFSGLSFEAMPGDMVAIIGSNGSGKSSILKLAKGLYIATSGAIRIDGFDMRQLDSTEIRRQIAYIPQIPELFQGSISDNLRFANPLANRQEIEQALRLAEAWDEIQLMPEKLDTMIGTYTGTKITPSLTTKISLARAYIHPSNLLLIDELPNTMLSGPVGENLRKYLDMSKGKRTVIIATYRHDFLQRADTIVYLRGSETPLVGPRDSMIQVFQKGKAA